MLSGKIVWLTHFCEHNTVLWVRTAAFELRATTIIEFETNRL